MALKTPEQYLDEIRAREVRIFYRGQRFENPVDHPVAAPAARCVAETYAAALEPGSGMAAESPLIGGPVNVSNLLWRSRDDLIARVKWERLFGRRTGRGALRSPGLDAINALAVVTHACDGARGTRYHERLIAFVERIQRDDLAVSGAMTDVRGDRGRARKRIRTCFCAWSTATAGVWCCEAPRRTRPARSIATSMSCCR